MKKLIIFCLMALVIGGLCSCEKDEVPKDVVINVTEVNLNETSVSLMEGETVQLIASILPVDADNKLLSWKSSDQQIANVVDGQITAVKAGECNVTVQSVNDIVATCKVIVEAEAVIVEDCIDPDGRKYKTVVIGENEWMAENYAYLPRLDIKSDTTALESRCYISDNYITDIAIAKEDDLFKLYGVYYNFKAAKEYCPEGWHIPTLEDWSDLERTIGMTEEEIAVYYDYRGSLAAKLKSKSGWRDDNNGTDDFGFNAIPAGYTHAGKNLAMWKEKKATFILDKFCEGNSHEVVTRTLKYTEDGIEDWYILASQGTSVRYVKNK